MPAQKRKNAILNERGASSWDLVLKILSITLVSLFAFSSGVWFGKKLSDSDHQRMALEGEFDKEVRKTASTDEKENAEDKDALTDEEVAAAADKALESSKAKTEVAEKTEAAPAHGEKAATKTADAHEGHGAATGHEAAGHEAAKPTATISHEVAHEATEPKISTKPAAKVAETSHDAHAAPTKTDKAEKTTRSVASTTSGKPDLSAVHQAAVRVANNATPTEKEKPQAESRVPSSLPKTVGAANDVEFTVQVASYPTADAAKQHVEAMVKKGFPAFPVEAKINGKTWYRVSVGSFKSFNDASKFRAQLLKQAELPSAIVQKVTR
jgi:cell division protein FtsN